MIPTPLLQLAVALGLGLLVGMQRERMDSAIAGIRTFAPVARRGRPGPDHRVHRRPHVWRRRLGGGGEMPVAIALGGTVAVLLHLRGRIVLLFGAALAGGGLIFRLWP